MEKWKIAVIVALLAALPVYGYFQNAPQTPASGPTEQATSGQPVAPDPPAPLRAWWGKASPTWNFGKDLWFNSDKPISQADFKGKVVLLEMWRAECSHCQHSIPFVEQLSEKHKARGLQVIGVHSSAIKGTIEFNWPELKKWMTERGVKYPVAYDETHSLWTKFKGEKFPTFIIIDRNGIIRYAHQGYTPELGIELQAALEQILDGKIPQWPPSKAAKGEDHQGHDHASDAPH